MSRILIPILLLFGVLFSGVGVPAIAHAHGHEPDHVELLDHVESGEAFVDKGDQTGDAGKIHDGIAPHHHCAADMVPGVARMAEAVPVSGPVLRPARAARMTSRALAPPTEPPAA